MNKLVYGYYEGVTMNEISELAEKAGGKMLIKVINFTSCTFRLEAYGMMEESLAEYFGLEDANCGMFQESAAYQAIKRTYERMRSNGEF